MSKKLRVWDSKVLADVYTLLLQMQNGIEEIVRNTGVISLSDLPHSMIPTKTLYEISLCYEVMYHKLVEYDLLNTGNTKPSSTMN